MIEKAFRLFRKVKDLRFGRISYSQEAEDLILERIFEFYQSGFYVDVGAHHPKRFSNTYLFYKKGWNGINIDAMPNSMRLFNKIRPKDINLELGVSQSKKSLLYYMFDEPALNGFSENVSEDRNKNTSYKIIGKQEISTLPLSEILNQYVEGDQAITFLSIDVEGLDLEVLKSNDWNKYRPEIILDEILHSRVEDILNSEINLYLQEKNYAFYCKTPNTVFYKNIASN
ncbi:FkbM family methyltransferase [Pontibacter aydingkolensis]|uniref:FkbM family methyltransferase n=1 Tax=Pontibacter aydingkolensis TaxID=1911536 RepID=A0ABS7CYV1_9BACT|nr:FkbM family methyltransferase [Pontibacter aydingkolensis]MBW7469038.1 FkbM family methyltransferase [Pontibacter aydingkolensis]